MTQTGAPLRETDLDGRIHVASFVFSRCPAVCPMLLARLRPVQEAARGWSDVVLVSYSITPAVDTPDVLADLGVRRGIDPRRWHLVTGELAQITRLARESYFANDTREEERSPGRNDLLHSEKVLLVDGQRRLRGVYNGALAFEVERLTSDIKTLRARSRVS